MAYQTEHFTLEYKDGDPPPERYGKPLGGLAYCLNHLIREGREVHHHL